MGAEGGAALWKRGVVRRWMTMVGLVAVVGWTNVPTLTACGDKFLSLTRGTRFDQPARRRSPARVVIYARPGSGLPQALRDLPIEVTLQRAGYTTTVVSSSTGLDGVIRGGQADLIVLALLDAPSTAAKSTGVGGPDLLPVVFGRKDAEVKAALKQFTCAVTSSGRNQSFLDAVDEALEIRRKKAATAPRAAETAPR